MSKDDASTKSIDMRIDIEALSLTAIIGILDFERMHAQKIVIDSSIDYAYQENNFIDYAEVIHTIEENITTKKYKLLEDALNDITQILLLIYPQIQELYLKISKPNIIPNANVALSMRVKR